MRGAPTRQLAKFGLSGPTDHLVNPDVGRFEVDDGEILFIHVAASYLARGREHDTWGDNDQPWYNCMSLCGIRSEVQVSIMDPVYKRIRLTESCYFWMKDTIELRYRGLEAAQRASRERATSSRPGRSDSGRHGRVMLWRGPRGSCCFQTLRTTSCAERRDSTLLFTEILLNTIHVTLSVGMVWARSLSFISLS
jgi:hypothetical protein